jgi:glycosyltransferase involved in cell wall biosynthesis
MPEKKRILFVCKGHQNIAGAQLYLQHVSEVFDQTKYALHYAFNFNDGNRVFNEINKKKPITTWEYDWRHLGFKSSFDQGLRLIKKIRPHLIIYNSSEDKIMPCIVAGAMARTPCQAMVVHWAQDAHSLPLWSKKKGIPFPILSRYSIKTRLKRSIAYAMLDKLIFVNNITRFAYKKLYNISHLKSTTIYNGIHINTYSEPSKSRHKTRRQLSLNDSQVMLLATGNLSPVKGHSVLIDAIEMILSQGKSVHCFIAGQGELKSSLRTQIDQKKLSDNVTLLGYRDDIPQLLSSADIFCMPSLNEALGYSLLEAMAAGLPVIASNVGGIPEVINDSKNGLLVTPGMPTELSNAIVRLIDDEHLRFTLGQKAKRHVASKFSIDHMRNATANFLKV